MKYIFTIFLTLFMCACNKLFPDNHLKDVWFTVDRSSVTIHQLFDDGSSYYIDLGGGVRSCEITVERGDESYHLSFTEIIWAMNIGEYNSGEIASFLVNINGHNLSFSKLYINDNERYLNPSDEVSFSTNGNKGKIVWSFQVNASGGSIDQNGLYRVGPKGMTKDIILATDEANQKAMATMYIGSAFDIESEFNVHYAGLLVWDKTNMWLYNSKKLYKIDPITGLSESEIINLELPQGYIAGITSDSNNFWALRFYSPDSSELYRLNKAGNLVSTYDLSNLKYNTSADYYQMVGLCWDGKNLWTSWIAQEQRIFDFIKIDTNAQILDHYSFIKSNHFDNSGLTGSSCVFDIKALTWDGDGLCIICSRLGCTEDGHENKYFNFWGQGLAWDGNCFWISRAENVPKLYRIKSKK
jgi:hypothetical protein